MLVRPAPFWDNTQGRVVIPYLLLAGLAWLACLPGLASLMCLSAFQPARTCLASLPSTLLPSCLTWSRLAYPACPRACLPAWPRRRAWLQWHRFAYLAGLASHACLSSPCLPGLACLLIPGLACLPPWPPLASPHLPPWSRLTLLRNLPLFPLLACLAWSYLVFLAASLHGLAYLASFASLACLASPLAPWNVPAWPHNACLPACLTSSRLHACLPALASPAYLHALASTSVCW